MIRHAAGIAGLALRGRSRCQGLCQNARQPAAQTWRTTNGRDLKFSSITSITAKTGQASTVVDRGADTYIVVHEFGAARVPGDDVRALFIVKPDGAVEFRGQKTELVKVVEPCNNL
ncbi:hypothetical protein AB5I41_28805 [Sphingomonas sp. MMS24-JH45]